MINLHYLELFYFVARHGGISEAARRMPYGIQQSTLSRQLIQLEDQLGTDLLERRPFRLTPAGERLFRFVRPFLEDLDGVADELRGGLPDVVRLAASPVVLQDYLPPMLRAMRNSYPRLRFTLKEGLHSQIKSWFEARLIDLAVTTLEGSPPTDCLCEALLHLPLVLLVSARSPLRSAKELFSRGRVAETLISPRADDAISRRFRDGLLARSLDWDIGIEVNSIALVEAYVLQGFGLGVSVKVPGYETTPGVRMLPMEGFPPVDIGVIWRRNPNPPVQVLMEQFRIQARQVSA